MGPPLEALSPSDALGRRHPGAFGRVGSNGINIISIASILPEMHGV